MTKMETSLTKVFLSKKKSLIDTILYNVKHFKNKDMFKVEREVIVQDSQTNQDRVTTMTIY